MNHPSIVLGLLAAATLATQAATAATPPLAPAVFNVRELGARGDGITPDTEAIQQALDEAGRVRGSLVRLPPGRYLSGTLRLRSGITVSLEAGATLLGTTNLASYSHPEPPAYMPEAKWGKWHRGLIIGQDVEDVTIMGPGVIDGNRVFDPTGEERMRGPHTIVFIDCRRFTLRDLSIVDSANYAVLFQVSDDVEIRNVTFVGGWDGVHWRGAPQRWCRNVRILDCRFFTGDDSIAGRYWDNTLIAGCVINSSCNGLRLIGPATRLRVDRNVFFGPGEQPHRTSGAQRRTNMLSGIILQPGAWDATQGLLDDVVLADNTMHDVASPVTIWTKSGNPVGRITISGLNATGVYRSAFSVESWADAPITNVVLRQATIEFAGGGTADQAKIVVKGPGVDARPLPAWGVYARNVEHLQLEDVRLSVRNEDLRPAIAADTVGTLTLDNVRLAPTESVPESITAVRVGRMIRR